MTFVLTLIIAVCLTYLITDFRRYLQIKMIRRFHAQDLVHVKGDAWVRGYKHGESATKIRLARENMFAKQ